MSTGGPSPWAAQRWGLPAYGSSAKDQAYSDNSDMVSSEMDMNDIIDDGGSGSGSGGSTEDAQHASGNEGQTGPALVSSRPRSRGVHQCTGKAPACTWLLLARHTHMNLTQVEACEFHDTRH